MVATLVKILADRLSGISWIDLNAGMSKAISRDQYVETESGAKAATVKESFPIAWNTDQNTCWQTGEYMDLMPNDKYKSVVYWEDLSGLQLKEIRSISGKRSLQWYEARLRMVCWLNVKKMGYQSGEQISSLQLDVIKTLNGYEVNDITNPIKIKSMAVSLLDIPQKDSKNIFGKYTYGNRDDLFMYPYDYFAIDFKVIISLGGNCDPVGGVMGEIAC